MKNYLNTEFNEPIDQIDLQLPNCRRALEKAMANFNDGCLSNYYLITVDGYKCIAHSSDDFTPIELDETIVPFDEELVYPCQGLETHYAFKLIL